VWREMAQLDPYAVTRKLACYEHWMALPLRSCLLLSKMLPLPKYLCLNLSRHAQHNFSCIRVRAQRLVVETDCWRHNGKHQICSCVCAEHQDEKQVLLACRFLCVHTLGGTYSDLFGGSASLFPNTGTSYAESSRAVPVLCTNL